jgi:hypothetical protein
MDKIKVIEMVDNKIHKFKVFIRKKDYIQNHMKNLWGLLLKKNDIFILFNLIFYFLYIHSILELIFSFIYKRKKNLQQLFFSFLLLLIY